MLVAVITQAITENSIMIFYSWLQFHAVQKSHNLEIYLCNVDE